MQTEESVNILKERAIRDASCLQPWEGYYRLRAQEMEVLLSLYDMKRSKKVLEIGCGNGFISAILSCFAEEVVATDLSRFDMKTHSIGIKKTHQLFDCLGVRNCTSVSCSGEKLPFKDGTFDFIFCAYTLEHVLNRDHMLKEVKRVLTDGGEAIFILPTFMHWLFYPVAFYTGLLQRGTGHILRRFGGKSVEKDGSQEGYAIDEHAGEHRPMSRWRRFRMNYPHFPLPEPHGAYSNYFIELFSYTIHNWLRLFKRNGLNVTGIFSTMLMPREALMLFVDPLRFYERHCWIDKRFGPRKFFRRIGQNVCIVVKK